jgi:hypothetical protein
MSTGATEARCLIGWIIAWRIRCKTISYKKLKEPMSGPKSGSTWKEEGQNDISHGPGRKKPFATIHLRKGSLGQGAYGACEIEN